MQVEHHPLVKEFPELKEKIQSRKQNDTHFAKKFDEYEGVDKAVNRAENGVEHLSDAALETLKKQRLNLKDDLYKQLTSA